MLERLFRGWKAASAVCAIGSVLLFAQEIFAQGIPICSQDPAVTGMVCTEEECIIRQALVEATCKTPGVHSCMGQEGCEWLEEIKAKREACLVARLNMKGYCFPRPNPRSAGHDEEIRKVVAGILVCDERIAMPQPIGCANPCP
jgi:hypothetical protein